jgi:hypothetical protein
MNAHPKWFAGVPASERKHFINSLAKRIVGEIVACIHVSRGAGGVAQHCDSGGSGGVSMMPPSAQVVIHDCGLSGDQISWSAP